MKKIITLLLALLLLSSAALPVFAAESSRVTVTEQAQLFSDEKNYIDSLHSKYYTSSVSSRAFSKAEIEWMKEHKDLRIGYLDDYLPYSDKDENGDVSGIIKDIMPTIMENLGITDIDVGYTGYPSYDEMVAAMSKGDIDAAFPVGGGLYYSEENGIYQSNPVVSSAMEFKAEGFIMGMGTKIFVIAGPVVVYAVISGVVCGIIKYIMLMLGG